jgi:hypothetical protein
MQLHAADLKYEALFPVTRKGRRTERAWIPPSLDTESHGNHILNDIIEAVGSQAMGPDPFVLEHEYETPELATLAAATTAVADELTAIVSSCHPGYLGMVCSRLMMDMIVFTLFESNGPYDEASMRALLQREYPDCASETDTFWAAHAERKKQQIRSCTLSDHLALLQKAKEALAKSCAFTSICEDFIANLRYSGALGVRKAICRLPTAKRARH